MPSVSKKQHNLMAAVAHSPSFAKKAGIAQSVGKDFVNADKGRTFKKGDDMKGMKKGGLAMRGEGIAKKGFAKGGMADNSGQSPGDTLSRPTKSIPGEKVNVRGVGAARSRTAMIY